MAYIKTDVKPKGDPNQTELTDTWGDHIQTQYDEAVVAAKDIRNDSTLPSSTQVLNADPVTPADGREWIKR